MLIIRCPLVNPGVWWNQRDDGFGGRNPKLLLSLSMIILPVTTPLFWTSTAVAIPHFNPFFSFISIFLFAMCKLFMDVIDSANELSSNAQRWPM